MLGRQDGHQRHDGNGNGGGRDRHLRRDRCHGHRALRADPFFQGDIRNNREHGVDHMAGAAQKGQHPGGERGEQGDVLRVFAQQAFSKLHHDVEAARSLQRSRTANHRKDGQHNVNRRFTRLQTKDKT